MTSTTETAPAVPAAEVKSDAGDNAVTDNNATDGKTESSSSPKKTAEPKPQVHKQDFEKDVVYLYGFPRAPTIPSVSASSLRLETFVRVAGIKYEVRETILSDHL